MNFDPNFIVPMQGIKPFSGLDGFKNAQGAQNAQAQSFTDVFKNAVDDVKNAENALSEAEYLLATGQLDDPHTVPGLMAQAQLATEMLTTLRTKALEAYQNLISTQV